MDARPDGLPDEPECIDVEVAYARPERQTLRRVQVLAGSTLEQAIRVSGILEDFPEIDLSHNKVGVFGKVGRLDDTLRSHDRVEIYRPLRADPKAARRQRASRDR